MARIVRNAPDGVRELCMARWGMPSSQLALMESAKRRAAKLDANGQSFDFKELLRMEPDSGTTNIRNTAVRTVRDWGQDQIEFCCEANGEAPCCIDSFL
jgi:hypothetical protein